MPLTNVARDFYAGAIIGVEPVLFDNANARIGVGDSTAVFDRGQTDLQAAAGPTHKFRKSMDAGYPTRAANQNIYKATFGPAEANFAWQEWAVFNANAGGTMLNRMVEYNGTKLDGQTWVYQVTLTLTLPVVP